MNKYTLKKFKTINIKTELTNIQTNISNTHIQTNKPGKLLNTKLRQRSHKKRNFYEAQF